MKNADIQARVTEALARTKIMALATIGEDGSWVCPVEYSYNDKLELTFLSMLETKHVQIILKDPRVSVAIYSYPGPEGGNLGLQIKGRVEHVSTHAAADEWHSFKIIPEEVLCFDSRIVRKRQRVDVSKWQLR